MQIRNVILLILILASIHSFGQAVLIDEGIEAGDLICFPINQDSTLYRYLPSRGRLSTSSGNLPEFSFLQYAVANENKNVTGTSVTEADGGGLLHFLVLYDTPENQIRKAERELQRKLKKDDLILAGPVLFTEGNFLLISSILRMGKEEKILLGSGRAPVFQNSKVAFSFLLDPLQAQLFMESFKMATPDISLMFDLKFSGLTRAYDGELIVDWSLVEKTSYKKESVDAIFYSSDVEETFGSLIKSGSIKLVTSGKDSLADILMQVAYDRLLDMMFEPARPEMLPSEDTGGFLDEVFGNRGILGSPIGGSNVYKKRTIRTSGKTVVNINTRKTVERNHMITFNIGDLYKKYGDNERIFRKVAIDDPTYQQRQILVNLDGSIVNEFENMVSSVSVSMNKSHENGEQTIREVFLNKEVLDSTSGNLQMVYLNKKDNDRLKWLEYDYQISWQFQKGGGYTSTWQSSNSPVINLFTPYEYREINLYGDHNLLKEQNVRAVSVEIRYPFFGKMNRDHCTIRVGDESKEYKLKAVLPLDTELVDYTINWILQDGKRKTIKGQDEFGAIFIDELPTNEQ